MLVGLASGTAPCTSVAVRCLRLTLANFTTSGVTTSRADLFRRSLMSGRITCELPPHPLSRRLSSDNSVVRHKRIQQEYSGDSSPSIVSSLLHAFKCNCADPPSMWVEKDAGDPHVTLQVHSPKSVSQCRHTVWVLCLKLLEKMQQDS